MNEKTIEKLNRLLELSQNDTVTPKELEQFVVMILDVIKKSREEFSSISELNKKTIQDTLEFINANNETLLSAIDHEKEEMHSELRGKVEEVNKYIDEIRSLELKNGEDGKDADEQFIIEQVLSKIKLPEYEKPTPETGETIVDKINALETTEENQIDASHIKNLPKTIQQHTPNIAHNLYELQDVNITSPTANQVIKYNATTGLWENGTGGGGSGTPGGSDTQVQFNDAGSFGGSSMFVFNKTTGALNLTATTGVVTLNTANTINIGNNTGTTGVNIKVGSDGFSLLSGNGGIIGIGNSATSGTIIIGDVGSGLSNVIRGGTSLSFQTAVSGSINIGTTHTNGATLIGGTSQTGGITLGQSTDTSTVKIASGNIATGKTQTINIGTGTTVGTGKVVATLGNTGGASSTAIKAGTGGMTIVNNGVTFTLPTADGTNEEVLQTNGSGVLSFAGVKSKWTVVSSDITAENDGQYTLVASATISDPTPVEGKGFWIVVRNGTLSLDSGTTYSAEGSIVYRIFHSGAWNEYLQSPYNDATSSIQTQLNSKLSVGTGTVTVTTNSQTVKYLNPVFGGITGGNVAISANNVYMTPFLVQDDLTILGLAHNVSGTSTLSMGIYSGNIGELGTINLVTNSGVSVATSGAFATYNVTYGTPITLTPGLYWLAFATTAIVNIQTIPNGTAWNPLIATSDALSGYQYMFRASVASSGTALPSSIATSANWTAQSRSNAPMNCKGILA